MNEDFATHIVTIRNIIQEEWDDALIWYGAIRSKEDRLEFIQSLLDDPFAIHEIGRKLFLIEAGRK